MLRIQTEGAVVKLGYFYWLTRSVDKLLVFDNQNDAFEQECSEKIGYIAHLIFGERDTLQEDMLLQTDVTKRIEELKTFIREQATGRLQQLPDVLLPSGKGVTITKKSITVEGISDIIYAHTRELGE